MLPSIARPQATAMLPPESLEQVEPTTTTPGELESLPVSQSCLLLTRKVELLVLRLLPITYGLLQTLDSKGQLAGILSQLSKLHKEILGLRQ